MDKFGRTESADTNASQESGGAQEQNLKSGKSKRKSKKGGDEVAEKNGGRVGMHAAPSAHGGKGLHCVSYEDIRCAPLLIHAPLHLPMLDSHTPPRCHESDTARDVAPSSED